MRYFLCCNLLVLLLLSYTTLSTVLPSSSQQFFQGSGTDTAWLRNSGWYVAASTYLTEQAKAEPAAYFPRNERCLRSTADSVLEGPAISSLFFGQSLTSAGDLNRDGYADVVIATPNFDGLFNDEGRAWVYYGSRRGLPVVPDIILSYHSNVDGHELFGYSVAPAGDINKDGYDDMIIGAPGASADGYELFSGTVLVYLGSARGIHSMPDKILMDDMASSSFGICVAGGGDINGDGYSDVIIGAPAYGYQQSQQEFYGRAYIYYGSPAGLPDTPGSFLSGEIVRRSFGYMLVNAGDINGDGFADIAVSEDGFDNQDYSTGIVKVYTGSDTGLVTTYSKKYTLPQVSTFTGLGRKLAGGNDLNGDGYSDLVINQPFYNYVDQSPGGSVLVTVPRFWICYGSPAGLATDPVIISQAPAGLTNETDISSAGDVNGDGYTDLALTGDHYDTSKGRYSGRMIIYHGSATGLTESGFEYADTGRLSPGLKIAGAGDIDGDGFDDLLVGAPNYSAGAYQNRGRVYIWHGAADDSADPLTVLSFSATKKGKDVLLSWSVAKNNRGVFYVIERSTDNSSFREIGRMPAHPHSNNYRWVDDHPAPGKNYYRIKAVDGRMKKYSNVLVVEFPMPQICVVYPNPVHSGQLLHIRIAPALASINVQLLNNRRKPLLQQQLISQNGLFHIRIPQVSTGLYWVVIRSGENIVSRPVLIFER